MASRRTKAVQDRDVWPDAAELAGRLAALVTADEPLLSDDAVGGDVAHRTQPHGVRHMSVGREREKSEGAASGTADSQSSVASQWPCTSANSQ
jgi:hypothetical protein